MIKGTVKRNSEGGLEAWVAVFVTDAYGNLQQCEVIVDTGFTGWLTLPETDIRRLGLIRTGYRDGITASGNTERFNYYQASVPWHGRSLPVEIFQSIDQPLLGMELLEGSRVAVDAWDGGEVIVAEA
jgi:clan AA aspartic protease